MKLLHNIDKDNDSKPYFLLCLCCVFLSSVFGTIGCSTELSLKESMILERHTINIDKAGKPYSPIEPSTCPPGESDACDDWRLWGLQEEETYLTNADDVYGIDQLILRVKAHFEGQRKKGQKATLLFFIHGGLNDLENTNERVRKLYKPILLDNDNEYYPIFLNWDSGLFSSYVEHLTSVRQGKTDRWALVTSPTYLATDIGHGLIRAPVVWWSFVKNDLTSLPIDKDRWFFNFFDLAKEEQNANRLAATLEANSKDASKSFKFWFGDKAPYTFWKDWVWGSTTTALTYPIKFLSSPWIDALGKSAWENMLRRTDIIFHTENDFQTNSPQSVASGSKSSEVSLTTCKLLAPGEQGLVHSKSSGALSIFFRKLTEALKDQADWSITLVGHSMGAIIVNHILRDFGTCLPIDNIVFMAAASTINSYNDSVFPLLAMRIREKEFNGGKGIPKVYHLMLHEVAETRETNFWNLPPAGSLLVWIDNFLSTPNTPMDRTSGRFTNLMLSLHTTPQELRPYISIKRYPGGGSGWGGTQDGIPANHSDFAERFKFWKEDCWKVPPGKDEFEKFQNEKNKNCFY